MNTFQLAMLLVALRFFGLAAIWGSVAWAQSASRPLAGMGIMVGELTHTSALVQVRLTQANKLTDGDVPGAPGVVEFVLRMADRKPASAGQANGMTQVVEATVQRDFIARAAFEGLTPGTRYVCETRIGASRDALQAGPAANFKTHGGPDSEQPVRFVVVTGMNYAKFHGDPRIDRKQHLIQNNTELPLPYAGSDKHLGYPALAMVFFLAAAGAGMTLVVTILMTDRKSTRKS